MPGTLPPGIGNDQQAMQATAFIRQQPWYLSWIQSLGKTPDANGNVKLNDQQQSQLRDMAVSKGIGLNNKYDGIDENGQIVEEHHKLRDIGIAAAIGGAALTGFGAAGMGPLSGLFGAGAGAAEGAGAGAAAAEGDAAATAALADSPWLAAGAVPATEGVASATSLGLPAVAGETAADGALASAPLDAGVFGAPASVASGAAPAAAAVPGGGFFSRAANVLRGSGGNPGGGNPNGAGSLFEKYALPGVSGVVNGVLANKRNQDQLQLQESTLDPYRGQKHQASDVAKLDRMATGDVRATPTSITGTYAHSYEPNSPWLPSDTVRNVAAQAENQVAGGQGAELGQPLPRVTSTGRTPADLAALLASLKKKGATATVDDPNNSPWLTGAA